MRNLIPLLLALAAASCARIAPLEPWVEAPLDAVFPLRVGQQAVIEDTPLRLRFVSVPEDSRCPVDVDCVWEGDAQVRLLLSFADSAEQTLDLHTSLEPRFESVRGYRITLERLEPAPRSEERIPQERYAADLRVSPAP